MLTFFKKQTHLTMFVFLSFSIITLFLTSATTVSAADDNVNISACGQGIPINRCDVNQTKCSLVGLNWTANGYLPSGSGNASCCGDDSAEYWGIPAPGVSGNPTACCSTAQDLIAADGTCDIPPSISLTAPNDTASCQAQQTGPTLTWTASDADNGPSPLQYHLYFSSDQALVTNHNASVLVTTTSATSYDTGTLNLNTTYYWTVLADDGALQTASVIQSFTTQICDSSQGCCQVDGCDFIGAGGQPWNKTDGYSCSGNAYPSGWQEKVGPTVFNSGATNSTSATTLNNGNILIAYANDTQGAFVINNGLGSQIIGETIFSSGSVSYPSATTLNNGNVLIAYGSLNNGAFVIYDSSGNQVVSETIFNTGATEVPSVAVFSNGNVLITYMDDNNYGVGAFVIYDSSGNQVVGETIFNSDTTYNPSATAMANGNILIAYEDYNNAHQGVFVIYDSSGNQVVGKTIFNSDQITVYSTATLINGNVLITYQNHTSNNAAFVIYDSNGNQVVGETIFDTGILQESSATTLVDGHIFIAYRDDTNRGAFVIYDSSGHQIIGKTIFDINFAVNNSTTILPNGNVLIAYGANNFNGKFVIWEDFIQASTWQEKVPATVFNSASTASPSPTTLTNGNVLTAYKDNNNFGAFVIDDNLGNQVVGPIIFDSTIIDTPSATTLNNGNVLIAYQDADGNGAFVVYDSNGNQVIGKTLFGSGIVYSPSPTPLSNGNVFIAYGNYRNSAYQASFVIYDNTGQLVAGPSSFGTYVTAPSAITLDNDNVLIAYGDGFNSGKGFFVIYDSSGQKIVANTLFYTGTTYAPSAVALTNGNVLIAYQDYTLNYGAFVIYDSVGNQVIGETVFNAGVTYPPETLALNNGNTLISYRDGNNDKGTFVTYNNVGQEVTSATVFSSGTTSEPIPANFINGNVLMAYIDQDNSSFGTFVIWEDVGPLSCLGTCDITGDDYYCLADDSTVHATLNSPTGTTCDSCEAWNTAGSCDLSSCGSECSTNTPCSTDNCNLDANGYEYYQTRLADCSSCSCPAWGSYESCQSSYNNCAGANQVDCYQGTGCDITTNADCSCELHYDPDGAGGCVSDGTYPIVNFDWCLSPNNVVQFMSTITGGSGIYSTYTWDFADGTCPAGSDCSLSDPLHTYDTTATYDVKLIVTDDTAGQGSKTNTIDLNASGKDCATPFNFNSVISQSSTQLILSWDYSLGNGSYAIYRNGSQISNPSYSCNINTCTYTDTGLSPGTLYSYYLVATASNTYNSTTNPSCDGALASAPDYCSLSAYTKSDVAGLTVTSNSCGRLNVQWDDLGSAYDYRLYRNITSAETIVSGDFLTDLTNTANCTGGTCTYNDNKIVPAQSYYYKVTSVSSAHGESTLSDAVSGTASSYCYRAPSYREI